MSTISSITVNNNEYIIKKVNLNGVEYNIGSNINPLILELITGASVNGGGRVNGYIDISSLNISESVLLDVFNASQHNNYFGGCSRETENNFTSLIDVNIKFSIFISYGTNNPTTVTISKNDEVLFSQTYTADSTILPVIGYQRSDYAEFDSSLSVNDIITICISGNWAGTAVRIYKI